MEAAAELELSDAQYRMFRDWVAERCGLWFGSDSRFVLQRRLARRVRQLDLGSFAAYTAEPARDEARWRAGRRAHHQRDVFPGLSAAVCT
jgi:hypothetical protein